MLSIRRIPIAALVGIVLTTLFVLAAVFAPLIAPYGNAEIVSDVPWDVMSAAHWLGTDNLGRDLFSRMIYGARITLFIAVLATALSFSLGAILGFSAAVFGGWYDTLLSRLVDLLMSIPTLIMGLVVLSVLPSNLVTLILVMGILDSTRVYRLSRAVAVDINVMDYVEQAKLRGVGSAWIIVRGLLPTARSPLTADLGQRFPQGNRRFPQGNAVAGRVGWKGEKWKEGSNDRRKDEDTDSIHRMPPMEVQRCAQGRDPG